MSLLSRACHLDAEIVITVTRRCISFSYDTATTEIYTLSLHDALPISDIVERHLVGMPLGARDVALSGPLQGRELAARSEEHTSELQSQADLVCRLLLEKKKTIKEKKGLDHPEQHDKLIASSWG